MDSKQKEVQQAHLDEEKRVIRKLKQVYKQASRDCEEKIQALASRTDMENLQSIIYQKQYQQALKTQIDGILDTLQTNEFDSVAEYLTTCYENDYVGTMYTLHGQGIPVITSIDQTQVVNAVQTESKLSENLYTRLGEDTGKLKKFIQSEMSRGIANGSTWLEVAKSIASGMNSPFKKAMNNAIRIARTEGGRIISQASLDAAYKARASGADSVKQWNATLDGRTRPDHRAADGQIRELDEYFTVGGEKMKAPCVGGSARNVCNCRCCMDMIPRWTLDEGELQRLKDRAAYFGLDKTKDFEEFREKYLKAVAKTGDSGIIKLGGDSVTISSIDSPIEQRNTSRGKPGAILHYDVELNTRQQSLLNSLQEYDSRVTISKADVSMADLSALTAKTGDEFAMFTKAGERLIVRGNSVKVNITPQEAQKLSAEGYTWSGHTHPGTGRNCLIASRGDVEILKCFDQLRSCIYNSAGEYLEFWKE
ncbi:MAG: phage head morphogenesis protein [Clostridiales bacterium]|nr:phage head morphogenesis protein [Clostridiales bacterium]